MKTLKFVFEINWPLKLSLSFLNKAVDNNDNSSLKTFVQELSNADPTLYLSHQHLHNLCKFEKNFESTEKVMVAMKYAIKVLHHDATPKLNDLKSALPALKYHENHRKFIPIVLQGTIHILRKLLYSPKLNLTSKFFTKTIFSSKPTNFFFNITFWRNFYLVVWNITYINKKKNAQKIRENVAVDKKVPT